jgi:hypothetical protein
VKKFTMKNYQNSKKIKCGCLDILRLAMINFVFTSRSIKTMVFFRLFQMKIEDVFSNFLYQYWILILFLLLSTSNFRKKRKNRLYLYIEWKMDKIRAIQIEMKYNKLRLTYFLININFPSFIFILFSFYVFFSFK